MTIQMVRLDDACNAVLNYIKSVDFEKVVRAEDRNAFMAGLGMASVVIMANCDKYDFNYLPELEHSNEKEKTEEP